MKTIVKIFLLCVMPLCTIAQNDPTWGFVTDQQAYSLKRSLKTEKNDTLLMSANRSLGFYYQETKLDSGLYYHQQQLKLATKLAIKMWMADAYSQVGYLFNFTGNPIEAYKNFMEAEKIAEDEKNESSNWHHWVFSNSKNLHDARLSILAMNYNGLAGLYNSLGEPKKRMDAQKECLRLGQQIKNGKILATIYGNMAGRLSPDSAILYLKKSMKYEDESGYKKNRGSTLLGIARNFVNKQRIDSAIYYARASMQANLEQNNLRLLVSSYGAMVTVHQLLKNPDSCLFYANKTLEVARITGQSFSLLYAYQTLSIANQFNNKIESAFKYEQLANKLNDSLKNVRIYNLTKYQKSSFDEQLRLKKLDEEKKELAQRKELELKALSFEYEKKQAEAKNEKEKQQLKYEQQLKQQQIEADYALKTAQVEEEQKRKEALIKLEQEKRDAANASALELSKAEVHRQSQQRNFFLAAFALLAVLVGFIGYSYAQKRKANQLLEIQKTEIVQKSLQLEKSLTELKSTQKQLIQSEKLASLGELTAGIAHEIQNPLNFVNNFSELSVDLVKDLKDEFKKPEKDEVYIDELFDDLSTNQEKINLHGKRASSIVSGMLEHSRASTGERVLTDINKLADESLRLSYHGLRAKDKTFNSDFELISDPNLPKINVISQDIGRVLINLINNAFYAVNVGRNGISLAKVIVSTKKTENTIEIRVTDNGTGMSEAIKAKIFQPFFTTKPTGQGTGLGLSLAYDIITKGHGGTIEVESVEGEGTTFIIKLPIQNK